ncbi:hypothetical protein HYC85_019571 [Camellia sinensis]|uniref:Pentacotripeptide-repeat region of PRORP domain-containing protein n=1 Tax=Camellia sinensis TaxID=4442 RepID=A0A7J7GMA1_CAMSI|nr:hypothetical protein HYC85_019571 [Camellia sinensis]
MGHGLRPSSEIYNSIIHGFARKGRFKDALYYLKKMEEIDLKPDTETYDGLIQAYGKYRMYDEMDWCVKKMEVDGCPLDHITYNLLIQEFSRAWIADKNGKTISNSHIKKNGFAIFYIGCNARGICQLGDLGTRWRSFIERF